jgi:hypothetical protein
VWRVKTYRADVYVSVKSIMGVLKVSLHEDRKCLYKLTSEHRREMDAKQLPAPTRNPFARWMRLPTPDTGIATALLITMPTDNLRASGEIGEKEIHWLKPAPAGQTVKVAFLFTRQTAATYGMTGDVTAQYLGHSHLANGETIVLLSKHCGFDGPTFSSSIATKPAITPQYLTEERDLGDSDGLRAIFHGDPPEEGTFELIDAAVRVS